MTIRRADYARYNGQLYVKALEAPKLAPKPKPVPPAGPPEGETDPFAEKTEELQKTPEEAIADHLKIVTIKIIEHAVGLLEKAKIVPLSLDPKVSGGDAANPRNMMLRFDIASGNLKGSKATLFFNYKVSGVNAEGTASSFWDSLTAAGKATGEKLKNILGRSSFPLETVVFHDCGTNYGAKASGSIPNIPKLLEAVGVVQNPKVALTKVLKARSKGEPLRGSAEAKVLKEVVDFVEEERKKDPGITVEWGNKDFLKKLITAINAKAPRLVNNKELASLLVFIDDIPNLEEFMRTLMQEGPDAASQIAGVSVDPKLLVKTIASITNAGQYTINYTAWDKLAQSANDDGSLLFVEIAAPMIPMFAFDVTGGKPNFESMNIQYCERTGVYLETKNAKGASKLAWSGVVIKLAKGAGINPPTKSFFAKDQFLTETAKKALQDALKAKTPEGTEAPGTDEGGGPVPQESILRSIQK